MKKFFIFSLIAVFITACSKYDDGDLWDKVNDLDTRVETLEKAAKTTNSDIESLRSLLTALQKNVLFLKSNKKKINPDISSNLQTTPPSPSPTA